MKQSSKIRYLRSKVPSYHLFLEQLHAKGLARRLSGTFDAGSQWWVPVDWILRLRVY